MDLAHPFHGGFFFADGEKCPYCRVPATPKVIDEGVCSPQWSHQMGKKLFIVESSTEGDLIIGIPRDARDDFEALLRLGEEHNKSLACQLLEDLIAQKQIMQQAEKAGW